jgi:Icc-related predicted phosphoesterase
MSERNVLLISDIHTHYDVINAQIRHAETDCGQALEQVVVLGDFGFFGDQFHDYFRRRDQKFTVPVACIEGNHEDHGALYDLAKRYSDVLTYLPRGTLAPVGSWRSVCLGGARYMDAWSTPRGCEISESDIGACLAHEPDSVDLVLSHDCPVNIGVPNTPGLEHYGAPGVPGLEALAERFRPRWWFFGHHHRWFDESIDGTRYVGLPQSWLGYALLSSTGQVQLIHNEVPIESRSRLKRWFGLR